MSKGAIRRVIILGVIAVLGILGMQSYWVVNTWNLKEQEFHQSVHIALLRVAKSIAGLNESVLPAKQLIRQMSSNYYVVNTNSDINAGELEYLLQKEFHDLELNVDFEYAIHDCQTNEMVYGDYCNYTDQPVNTKILGDLPEYDDFTYYFGVKFPTISGYLISRMQSSVILTIILLITVLFFVYSMFIILNQKRSSEMQKDFINNMTHEFKTPISTINIASNVFLQNDAIQSDARLHKYATIIYEQNKRLNNQVEKVLQIASLEKDNFKLKLEDINLHELLSNILKNAEPRLSEKEGELHKSLNALETNLKADKLHLTNILYNLIDNAIKYCKQSPDIEVTTQNVNDRIELLEKSITNQEDIDLKKWYHLIEKDILLHIPILQKEVEKLEQWQKN